MTSIPARIFSEIVNVIAMRAGHRIAVGAGSCLLLHPRIRIVHVDENLQRRSWEVFQATEGKNISFVDCSIAALMGAEGIRKLLTFDGTDFKKLQSFYRFFILCNDPV